MMPSEIKYDANATPPQWTNNADVVIETGTHVRVNIKGLRVEVGDMWAIGNINGDYLGCVFRFSSSASWTLTIVLQLSPRMKYGHPG